MGLVKEDKEIWYLEDEKYKIPCEENVLSSRMKKRDNTTSLNVKSIAVTIEAK